MILASEVGVVDVPPEEVDTDGRGKGVVDVVHKSCICIDVDVTYIDDTATLYCI